MKFEGVREINRNSMYLEREREGERERERVRQRERWIETGENAEI